jgi:ABC-type phosphate transport system permease subunit
MPGVCVGVLSRVCVCVCVCVTVGVGVGVFPAAYAAGWFSEPVDTVAVPDYLSHVKTPMVR